MGKVGTDHCIGALFLSLAEFMFRDYPIIRNLLIARACVLERVS